MEGELHSLDHAPELLSKIDEWLEWDRVIICYQPFYSHFIQTI